MVYNPFQNQKKKRKESDLSDSVFPHVQVLPEIALFFACTLLQLIVHLVDGLQVGNSLAHLFDLGLQVEILLGQLLDHLHGAQCGCDLDSFLKQNHDIKLKTQTNPKKDISSNFSAIFFCKLRKIFIIFSAFRIFSPRTIE